MARRREKISPLDFSEAMAGILKEYGEDLGDSLEEAVSETAKEAADKLRRVNHFAPGGHPTGAYAASWTYEAVRSGRFSKASTVYNEDHYQLPHLLEFGHAKAGGGRVQAYPHIAQVNDEVGDDLAKNLEKRLSK